VRGLEVRRVSGGKAVLSPEGGGKGEQDDGREGANEQSELRILWGGIIIRSARKA
jgi:hypothetical protein